MFGSFCPRSGQDPPPLLPSMSSFQGGRGTGETELRGFRSAWALLRDRPLLPAHSEPQPRAPRQRGPGQCQVPFSSHCDLCLREHLTFGKELGLRFELKTRSYLHLTLTSFTPNLILV